MAAQSQIVIATKNQHKFSEIHSIFAGSTWEPILAEQLGVSVPEVAEIGDTFASNALLKAQAFSTATHVPVVADDTGLEVSALQGAPGVHSNRWHPGTYKDRNRALLQKLAGITDRSARFVTVACVCLPDSQPVYFTGTITGTIGHEMRGSNGFGYDSLFIPDGFTQTFAELDAAGKQKLSHRAQAFTQVVHYLESL